jgi:hypothetical protein
MVSQSTISTAAHLRQIYIAYCPAQRDLNKLIPYDILSLLRGQTRRLISSARPMDRICVDDVVDGMIITAQSEALNGFDRRPGHRRSAYGSRGGREDHRVDDLVPVFGTISNRQWRK